MLDLNGQEIPDASRDVIVNGRNIGPTWVVDGDEAVSRYGNRIKLTELAGLFKRPDHWPPKQA
jgi:hypothetical protein